MLAETGDAVFQFESGGTGGEATLNMYRDGTQYVKISADAGVNNYFNNGANVGIGIITPTSKLHINQNVTDPDLDLPSSFAVEIDSNHSGSAATTGDREQGGLYIDVDSSTTGGDTSDEHRVYGIYNTVNHSGDSDKATGVYSIVEQNTTAGATAYVLGGEFIGITDGGASATVNTVAGVWGTASIQDATPLINSYGGYFKNFQSTTRTGSTTSTYGLYTEVELNSDTTYTNIYGQRITLDVNTSGFTASRITLLDFSVTGLTDIPSATDTYAIHQPNDIKSYHEGNFGISSSNPESKLTVGGNAISTLKPTAVITDTTNGASLTLRGVSPVLYFDKTGTGVPKILMDDGGLQFKTGTLDSQGDIDVVITAAGAFGIGVDDPESKLQVAGGIQMADDTDTASATKVGTMRYRTGTEYVEVTGTELITNGDFEDGGANWNGSQTSPATVTFSNGKMTIVSPNGESAYRNQSILTPTKTYRATVDVVVRSGNCKLQWGTGTGATTSVMSATGSYVFYKTIPATGADALFYCARNAACDVDFDNVSVMEVTEEEHIQHNTC
jgi:hypothetical protein